MAKFRIWLSVVFIVFAISSNPAVLLAAAAVSAVFNYKKSTYNIFRHLPWLLLFCAVSFALTRGYSAINAVFLMFFRTVLLYNAFLLLTENMNYDMFRERLERFAGKKLSAELALSLNILPVLRRNFFHSYGSFYLRGNVKASHPRKYLSFLHSVLLQGLTAADRIAENMSISATLAGPKIYIITGEKHSGKTTRAMELAEEFKHNGWPVCGILSPGTMKHGLRHSIDIINAATGERRSLASRDGLTEGKCMSYGGFDFSEQGLEYARRALSEHKSCGIVFIDEIGPIELSGGGYAGELRELLKSDASSIFIIVRRELMDKMLAEFRIGKYEQVISV
jgi:nucleoside-triphosphatase THEP1